MRGRLPLTTGAGRGSLSVSRVASPIVEAIERVPRPLFVPEERAMRAYLDEDIPLGFGRICPSPSLAAALLGAAGVSSGARFVEVRGGTGYLSALAASLGARSTLIEDRSTLRARAGYAFDALDLATEISPYSPDVPPRGPEGIEADAIVVTTPARKPPRHLLAWLAPGGSLLTPLHERRGVRLYRFVRDQSRRSYRREELGALAAPDRIRLPDE